MTEARQVPLLDLTRTDPSVVERLEAAFRRVLSSGQYILGKEVDAFEQECAEYVGCRHAVAVSSGTDALLVALMALGVGPGDEVICPTYSFFATAGVIWRLGARPVFVDSRERCFNMDPDRLEPAFSPRTKAVVPVHLFGQCAEMTAISEIARRRGVPIVEDAAQAFGAEHGGQRAGALGALGCFSFFPSKNLGALGDAGLVTTNDDGLADAVRVLRVHGGRPKYHHRVVGGNFRIDALQAALLRAKLPLLDGATARRNANASFYTREFVKRGVARIGVAGAPCSALCRAETASQVEAPLVLPSPCGGRHVMNQFVVVIPGQGRRDRVRRYLSDRGVGTEVYYPVPLHLQPCFSSLGYGPGAFPVAERLAAETLALPIFPELRPEELEYVVSTLVDAVSGAT